MICCALPIGTPTGCETLLLTEAELGQPPPEIPDGGERWVCQSDSYNATADESVVLTRSGLQDRAVDFGQVFVAGVTHSALFPVQGVERRWDWNDGKDAMVIESDGDGRYYNFRLFVLGDLIDRGPRSIDALEWMECARITLAVRGNHEQMLHERIQAAHDNPDAYGLRRHPWFVDDVERSAWPRWTAMIETMPIAATIHTRAGRVGLVHAAPTARHWDTMIGKLAAGDTDTLWTALDHTGLARRDRRSAELAGVAFDGQIDGVRAALTGHAILAEVATTRTVWHLDTGAGGPGGRLTLARIDVDPIETVTVECRP